MTKAKEILKVFNTIANPSLAYSWDNVGLLIGDAEKEVKKVLLSLDVTENAVEKAIQNNVDMIISHHPIIFRAIKNITNPLFLKIIKHDIVIFNAHTNFDVIKNGVNYALAERLELTDLEFLSKESGSDLYELTVYVPQSHTEKLSSAVFEAGAGEIGNYAQCMNKFEVDGQFVPLENSNPYIGNKYELEHIKEEKLEFLVDSFNLKNVISAMLSAHPYETPLYKIYQLQNKSENYGLGLIGKTTKEFTLKEFAKFVKEKLDAKFVKLWLAKKSEDSPVTKVALCGGTGTSLLSKATNRADVFVSADFTYHIMLDSKIPIIDAGHFYTENPVLDKFENILHQFDLEILRLNPEEHEINGETVL